MATKLQNRLHRRRRKNRVKGFGIPAPVNEGKLRRTALRVSSKSTRFLNVFTAR